MKSSYLILFVILLLCKFGANGQDDLLQKNNQFRERDSLGRLINSSPLYNISYINDFLFYKKAKELINSGNEDSISEAYLILSNLEDFDSLKYSNQNLKNDYANIENKLTSYYKKALVGSWILAWRGNNWGTIDTDKTKNEKLFFTRNEVFFFKNDSLIRRTEYCITNKYSTISKELDFQLYFFDNRSYWHINTKRSGADYNAKLKFDEKHVGLMFDDGIFCSDCGYEIYMTEVQSIY